MPLSEKISLAAACAFLWTEFAHAGDVLVYARSIDNGCEVGALDVETARRATLIGVDICPDNLFFAPRSRSLFVVDEGWIVKLDAAGRERPRKIAPTPEFDISRYADHELQKPDDKTLRMLHSTEMHVRTIGYLPDDALAIDLELEHPAGGSFAYLLRWMGARWSVVENGGCGTWELNCRFDALPGRSTEMWDWPLEQLVQYSHGPSNPHFIADEDRREMTDDGEAGYLVRRLEVDGAPVEIQVWTSASAHFDLVYPFEISLVHPSGTTTICAEQCRAALVDRYLLAQRFWGGTLELYDIASGESVLGELANAMWITLPRRGAAATGMTSSSARRYVPESADGS